MSLKIKVQDKNGKKVEDLTLDESVFGVIPNNVALAQYLRVFRVNQRQGTAHTKTRADVSGGGKKPWRQKGTGRARHGSTRSPIWRHGGVAHGPKSKTWSLNLPQKIKRLAFVSALSFKYSQDQIAVLDKFKLDSPKTKEAAKLLSNLKLSGKTLIVLAENDVTFRKSVSNLKDVKTALANTVNVYELLDNKQVLFFKDAVLKLQEKYAHK